MDVQKLFGYSDDDNIIMFVVSKRLWVLIGEVKNGREAPPRADGAVITHIHTFLLFIRLLLAVNHMLQQ